MTHSVSSNVWSELASVVRLARPPSVPALRNGAEAFTGSGIPVETRDPSADVASIVARGHRKVIGHYRRLLMNPGLTPAERADIEARLAREENAWPSEQAHTIAA